SRRRPLTTYLNIHCFDPPSATRRYSDPPSAYIPGFFALRTLRLVSLFSGRAIVPIFAHIRNADTDRRQPTSQDRDRKETGDLYGKSALATDAAGRSRTRSSGKRWNARGAPVNKTTRFAGIGGVVCADSSRGKVPTAVPGSFPRGEGLAARARPA